MRNRFLCAVLPVVILFVFFVTGCSGFHGRSSYKWKRSDKWSISRGRVPTSDVKLEMNGRVKAWLDYFQGPGRERFVRYLQRSGRYIPLMQDILNEYNIPDDVVYIALIESGFTASAHSHASAVGFWQFIRPTGSRYGLRIDPYVDERRDFVKSTHAAAKYLTDLYSEFGDWYLAFAGYNSGEGKVRKAIQRYGSKDFWELTTRSKSHFRAETKDYVPKFIAAAVIAKNPKKFGFKVDYHEPLEFEMAKASSQTDYEIIAKCSRTDYATIELLNPELVMGVTPPGESNYQIRIPKGKSASFYKTFARLPQGQRLTRKVVVASTDHHIVRRGETISKIARKYGVSARKLMAENNIRSARHLRVGKRLIIPGAHSTTQYKASKSSSDRVDIAAVPPKQKSTSYGIKRGDTLGAIAGRYGVSVEDLRKWNKIRGNKIVAGRKLRIYAEEPAAPSVPTVASASPPPPQQQTTSIEQRATSIENRATYRVKKGDTLYAIALRNDMTVAELCEANNISRKAMLRAGQRLKIKGPHVGRTSPKESAASDRMVLSDVTNPASNNHEVVAYKVKKGDTAWGIAIKHSVSISEIEGWNSGKNLKKIKPGDIIKLKVAKKEQM